MLRDPPWDPVEAHGACARVAAPSADSGVFVRLSFPKGEHRDVIVQSGEVTLGSAPDNNVILATDGMLPRHASIVIDQRGFTLMVASPDAGAHVNARPVREKALLRLGDVVSLRSVNMVLKPDADEFIRKPSRARADTATPPDRGASTSPPRAVLRGVSGAYFGKTVPIRGRIVIGRTSDCELVLDEPEIAGHHAAIEVYQGEIALRDLGSANGTLINGVQVRDAALHSGDQIAFDRNRFLLEAPGMPLRRNQITPAITPPPAPASDPRQPVEVTQTLRAIKVENKPAPAAQPEPAATPPAQPGAWSPWWLIVAGALIAVAIALLFLGTR